MMANVKTDLNNSAVAAQLRELKRFTGTGDPAGDLALTLCQAIKSGILRIADDAHPDARALLEKLADEATRDQD